MKSYANDKQPLLQREKQAVLISFDEQIYTTGESGETSGYCYETVWVPFPYDKGTIVSTIIRDRYSDDKMTAIINNHLLEANDSEHEEEYLAMQAWRAKAKEVATSVMNEPLPN